MIVGWARTMTRYLTAAVLLAAFAVPPLHAQQASVNEQFLFAPTPLGTGTGGFERESSLRPQSGAMPATAIPAPKPRPSTRPTANAAPPPLRANLPKVDFGALGGSSRTSLLAAPQPQALDLSRGVDLGGVSLGLATSRDNGSGSGGTGLVTLDTKTPIPVDPALATRQGAIPYLGLSLSAPTN